MKATFTFLLGLIFTSPIFGKNPSYLNNVLVPGSHQKHQISIIESLDIQIGALNIVKRYSAPGAYIYPAISVLNKGGEHKNVPVGIFLSNDNVFDESDLLLLAETKGVDYNEVELYNFNIFLDTSIALGKYYLLAVVDPYNNIEEANESNNETAIKFEIQPKNTDLSTTFLEGPALLKTGERAIFTTIFSNLSNHYLSFPTIYYYLSSDSVINQTDILLAKNSVSLYANYANTQYPTLTIPTDIAPQNYYILAIADANNSIQESDETNNLSQYFITIQHPEVDLYANYTPSDPLVIDPNEKFNIELNVINSGNKNSGDFKISYILSKDSIIDPNDIRLYNIDTLALPGNSSHIKKSLLELPYKPSFGKYFLIASIDDAQIVNENYEKNNLAFFEIEIRTFFDLEISNSNNSTKAVNPGKALYLEPSLHNKGADVSNCFVGYYLSKDNIFDSTDALLAEKFFSLIPSYGRRADTTVIIPAVTSPGNYYIFLVADSKNNISETDEINNIIKLNLRVDTATTDLIITSIKDPIYVKAGRTIHATFTETNIGKQDAGPHTVRFFFFFDTTSYQYPPELYETVQVPGLRRDSSITIDLNFHVDPSSSPGIKYLSAITDRYQEVAETNENNNRSIIRKVILTPLNIDVATDIYWIDRPQSIHHGTQIAPRIYYNDLGEDAASSHFYGFYLSKDKLLDSTDALVDDHFVNYIPTPPYTYFFHPNFTVPDSVAFGTYYLIVVADYKNNLIEFNESNNISIVEFTVTPPYVDLTTSFYLPNTRPIPPGSNVKITARAAKSGIIRPGEHYIGYYLSKDFALDSSDVFLNSVLVDSILFDWNPLDPILNFPSDISPGSYYLIARIDYTNIIAELQEYNNDFAIEITIGETNPDLTITSLVSSNSNPFPGSIFSLSVKETNESLANISNHYVGYFLSTNEYFDQEDIYLASSFVPSLAPSASLSLNPVVAIPNNVPEGYYYIIAIADYGNQYKNEVDEGNNLKSLRIQVGNAVDEVDLIPGLSLNNTNANAGSIITMEVTETNPKTGIAGFHYIAYYLSKDLSVSGDDYFFGTSQPINSLSRFDTFRSLEFLALPEPLGDGDYYILVVADMYNGVEEVDENNNIIGARITITNLVSGLEESSKALATDLYPNPTTGIIHLSSLEDIDEIEVINVAGTTVQLAKHALRRNSEIDLSVLEAGVYALKTKKEGRVTSTHKVVVVK